MAQHGAGLLERVLRRENMLAALKRVQVNGGAPGVDGMTVDELPEHLKVHWPGIRRKLEEGTYQPSPVKRTEIAKPEGGVRGVLIGYLLCRRCAHKIMRAAQKRPGVQTSLHGQIERTLIRAYQQHVNAMDA